ncbi:MAG: hypothetical protein JWM80_5149 [Cyanobacteria bacterium RYN_339]|nr:hypothetical protein [Cyanobacteria bacterium RYN_339]
MRQSPNRAETPSTAKSIGLAFLIVGGYWLAFGGLMSYVIETKQATSIARQLPPADPNGRTLQAGLTPAGVTYKNIELVPVGEPIDLDQNQLAFVGQTDEGYGLWSIKPDAGGKARAGGGGGRLAPRGIPAATGPVYLRIDDGRWQQVIQAGA